MYLIRHEIQYKDAKEKEAQNFLAHPRNIRILQKLNEISRCQLSYSPHLDRLALSGQSENWVTPFEMRIEIETAESFATENGEKSLLFLGFLDTFHYSSQGDGSLILECADPLITLLERDKPQIWDGSARLPLKDIFEQLMSNSFDRSGGKQGRKVLKPEFVQPSPKITSGLTNVGQMDLEFIRSTSVQYGYHFHFDHGSAKKDPTHLKVVFRKPDFTVKAQGLDQSSFLSGFSFQSGVGQFLDKVEVTSKGGVATATIQDLTRGLDSFKPKANAREASGYELVIQDLQPTMSSEEAQPFAEGALLKSALTNGDHLHFSSANFFSLGQILDIRKNDQIKPELPSRLLGKYLIFEITHEFNNRHWVHHYKAVRP